MYTAPKMRPMAADVVAARLRAAASADPDASAALLAAAVALDLRNFPVGPAAAHDTVGRIAQLLNHTARSAARSGDLHGAAAITAQAATILADL